MVLDQTALWLKLRGEDKVYIGAGQSTSVAERKRLKNKCKATDKNDPIKIAESLQRLAAFDQDHPNLKVQVEAKYSTAGDKYRLTLINISAVENWLDPEAAPKSRKYTGMLLVPCAVQCWLRDISEDGLWLRDLKIEDRIR